MATKRWKWVVCVSCAFLIRASMAQDPPPPQAEGGGPASPVAVEPLILKGDPVPGLPGATLQGFGGQYVLGGGAAAVWARVGKGDADWAVLGVRGGRIETIAADKGLRPTSSPDSGRILTIRASAGLWKEGTRTRASRDRLYIGECLECGSGLRSLGPGTADKTVWAWGSGGLQRVLGPGDTVSFEGKNWTLSCAGLLGVNASDAVLMSIGTSSPAQVRGLAIRDGKGLRVVAMEGMALPGRPSTLLRDSAMQFPIVFHEAVLAEDGGVLFRAYMEEGGKKRQGIWYLGESSSVPLLQEEDPYPLVEGAKVKTMRPLYAQTAERYVCYVAGRGPGSILISMRNARHDVFIRSDGAWYDTTDEWWLGREALSGTWYLSPGQPSLLFLLDFTVTQSMPSSTWYTSYRGLGLFDGKKTQGLLPGGSFMPHHVWPAHGEAGFTGCLVGGGTKEGDATVTQIWFLDAKDLDRGLVQPPVVLPAERLTVRLGEFLGWAAPGEAVVILPGGQPATAGKTEGIYRVRAKAAQSSPPQSPPPEAPPQDAAPPAAPPEVAVPPAG